MKGSRGWLASAFVLIGTLALWEIAERLIAAQFPLVPSPSAIGGAILRFGNPIWLNLRLTLVESVIGLVAGSALGLALAGLFVVVPRAERSLYNLVVTIHSIPLVAIAPLLLIWFGVGLTAPTIVAGLACFFPMAVHATRGLRAASAGALDLMCVLDASPWQTFLRVRLPASLPYLAAALKVAAPAAVLGATVGEWLGTAGVGYLLFSAMVNFQVELLWATMVIATGVALGGYLLVSGIERRFVQWSPAVRSEA